MTRATRVDGFLLMAAVMALTVVSNAATVVTQVESRARPKIWLLNLAGQQGIAHQQVFDDHDVSEIPVFDAPNLSGVDVVYLSPASGQLNMTAPEIDALENFVLAGGRLVVAADYSFWSDDFDELAANFYVSYGQGALGNPIIDATVIDFANPITNGAGGMVGMFRSLGANDGLQSTNPDFQILATYPGGQAALGFLEVGAGQIVFLTDFNTFDDTTLFDLDNQQFWTNLFDITLHCLSMLSVEIVCHADGTTFTVNVAALNACTGGTSMFTFTASGGAVGEELCFTALVNDGGFCCTTEICVTVPSCADCNNNGNPDVVDIDDGTSQDCNSNGVPDECDPNPDCNGNGVLDECDIADGTDADCNGNGVPDECDVADGTSPDVNGSGVPDECECLADINGDGSVDITDFLQLLGVWGPCEPGCFGDVDFDGDVGIIDFLELLANWGACP